MVSIIEKFDYLPSPERRVKIDHIRTFLEISNCGNFNRAAETLNVTQSTVSARVKAMEERFGRALFKRGHSGVELTSAGQHFRR